MPKKISRVRLAKKQLEEKLNVRITIQGTDAIIEGKPEDEYLAEKVLEALNIGFPFSHAIQIKEEDLMLEILPIKNYTKSANLSRIRARVIGTKGKTLRTLANLTKCFLEINDNDVGIIGDPEYIRTAQTAIISLIRGTKTANVYAYLEKHRPQPIIDLGLKEKPKL